LLFAIESRNDGLSEGDIHNITCQTFTAFTIIKKPRNSPLFKNNGIFVAEPIRTAKNI